MTTFHAVANALEVTPSRISQLFSATNAAAEHGITPRTLGALARIFKEDGIDFSLDAFYLEYDEFVAELAKKADHRQPPRPATAWDDAMPTLPSPEWIPARSIAHTKIAAAQIHPPRPMNSRLDCYYLDVSLRFGTIEHSVERDTILIGLREAKLSFDSDSYQIAHASLAGDAARPMEGIMVSGVGVTISVREHENLLMGNPLGESYIAIIEPVEGDLKEASVGISLHAPRRSFTFEVIPEDERVATAPSFTKDALLNLIYGESLERLRDPSTGFHLLATATIRRKAEE